MRQTQTHDPRIIGNKSNMRWDLSNKTYSTIDPFWVLRNSEIFSNLFKMMEAKPAIFIRKSTLVHGGAA
jgi:hypothetical protein